MTAADIERARAALLRHAEGYQAEVLGQLADMACDRGHYELEEGYRWLAAKRKWPLRREVVGDHPERCWLWMRHAGTVQDCQDLAARVTARMARNATYRDLRYETLGGALEAAAEAVGELIVMGRAIPPYDGYGPEGNPEED